MLKAPTEFVITFILISVLLMLALAVFITIIIHRYQQKQNVYFKDIETLKALHENTLLQSQLEIQEQTFQNISREIHDNIGQKLTLAKLHLNTLNFYNTTEAALQVTDSAVMIGEAINDLSNLSRSMSSEILLQNGLIKALEFEAAQLTKSGKYKINFSATGNTIFMDANTELILFRIAQEALNNIVKHSDATVINIELHYNRILLTMAIADNGNGFDTNESSFGTGLLNMKKRTVLLNGSMSISSNPKISTHIKIEIPLHANKPAL